MHTSAGQQVAVLGMSAIQLAAGCLDAPNLRTLQSRPLGILARSAAVLHAFRSAEIMRRAVSFSVREDAVPEGGLYSRAAATGGARAGPGGPSASGRRDRPYCGAAPARGARAAHRHLARGLRADDQARTRDAMPRPGPAGTPIPEAAPGKGMAKPDARPNSRQRGKVKQDSGTRHASSGVLPGASAEAPAAGSSEFIDFHPGLQRVAVNDLRWDLAKRLCSTPGFAPLRRLASAHLDGVGVAHAELAAA